MLPQEHDEPITAENWTITGCEDVGLGTKTGLSDDEFTRRGADPCDSGGQGGGVAIGLSVARPATRDVCLELWDQREDEEVSRVI